MPRFTIIYLIYKSYKIFKINKIYDTDIEKLSNQELEMKRNSQSVDFSKPHNVTSQKTDIEPDSTIN